MKNLKVFGIIALIAVMGLFASCITATSIGGTADAHGLFSGGGALAAVSTGATEIASYSVILGIVDSGYPEYVTAVKAAIAEGKKITTATKNILGFVAIVTAYAE